jgi:hypothetical protein
MHFLGFLENTLFVKSTSNKTNRKERQMFQFGNGAFRARTSEILQLIKVRFMKYVYLGLHEKQIYQPIG